MELPLSVGPETISWSGVNDDVAPSRPDERTADVSKVDWERDELRFRLLIAV